MNSIITTVSMFKMDWFRSSSSPRIGQDTEPPAQPLEVGKNATKDALLVRHWRRLEAHAQDLTSPQAEKQSSLEVNEAEQMMATIRPSL